MAEPSSSDVVGVEDDAARHRRERRELQSTVQQLKKSVNKNDKTRKKKVDADIKALEDAFAKRWEHFNEDTATAPVPSEALAPVASEDVPPEVDEKQHVSRKARRQANKEKRHADAKANEEVIDYDSQPEVVRRRNESASIDEQLSKRGLKVRSIASDGNCLFASIVDQTTNLTVRQLRERVADFLREHRSDYEPFVDSDYDLYCDKLSKENVWGGQVELQACAKLLQRSIEVIQGGGNEPIKISYPSLSDPPIVVTYHRYLYANGEHYNSTVEATAEDGENDDE